MFKRTCATLNIESDSVRLLCVKGQSAGDRAEAPVPPGIIDGTWIRESNALGDVISGLFRKTGASKNRVAASFTGFRAITRIITMPRLNDRKMKEAITWAARREMPVPPEHLYITWQVLEKNRTEQRVFLLGTPKTLYEPLLQSLLSAGIKPAAVNIKPLALARIADRPDAIVLDLEKDNVNIVVQKRGIPEVIRTILQQEDSLIEDTVQKVSEIFSRTVEYHNTHNPEPLFGPDTPVILTGSLADDSALKLVSDRLSRPAMLPVSPLIAPPGLPAALFAANIGIGLRNTALPDSSTGLHPAALDLQPDRLKPTVRITLLPNM